MILLINESVMRSLWIPQLPIVLRALRGAGIGLLRRSRRRVLWRSLDICGTREQPAPISRQVSFRGRPLVVGASTASTLKPIEGMVWTTSPGLSSPPFEVIAVLTGECPFLR
ncbi:hypothetical protein LshimejAT787_1901220 [Lyophyllum shimeji]|uniref:Uncharacterized protein n=1 Tax=Lyophyllum shimeji TaxID=47721 RepID=A0A9P3Q0X8_LYOSH|nr:hypothetical protein LshimejAT787_1901220 [Lyophyllum shimeji]